MLSPVSPASSISRVAATRIRPSAGTLSPASKPTMSPGHQLLGRDLDELTVAADARRHDQHLAQRGDALGGLALLVQTHHGVDHGQADDDQPGRDVLQGDDADDRRADQHELHQVAVLAQERLPARLLGLLGQLVRPVPLPTLDAPRPRSDRRPDRRPAGDRRRRRTARTSRVVSGVGVGGVTVRHDTPP